MSIEQQLVSDYNGSSEMLQNVHRFLVGFAPRYVDRFHAFASEFQEELIDKYGRLGWGVFASHHRLLMPERFTGRGFCQITADLLGDILMERFPILDVSLGEGDVFKYSEPEVSKSGVVDHRWLRLSDPTMESSESNKNSVILDGTIRQIVPDAPFILYSENTSQLENIPGFKYSPAHRGMNKYRKWYDHTSIGQKHDMKKQSLVNLLELVNYKVG